MTISSTPGPWQTSGEVSSDNNHMPSNIEVHGPDGKALIARCFYGASDKERTANARLIESAPMLLAALEIVTAYATAYHAAGVLAGQSDRQTPVSLEIDRAMNIIAQAKGE